MSANRLVIVGDGPIFKMAAAIAAKIRPAGSVRLMSLRPDQIAESQLEFLDSETASSTEVFAAIGMHALNYARFDLWAKIRLKGFRCASLLHPTACVESTARVADNCLVGPFVSVGPDATIERGSILLSHSSVASDARVGAFGWLAKGAAVGDGAQIGSHVLLGEGVRVADGVLVGDNCELAVEGTYRSDVAGGTFVDPGFDAPVRLYSVA